MLYNEIHVEDLPKTIVVDIDGTIIEHTNGGNKLRIDDPNRLNLSLFKIPDPLPDVLNKFKEWNAKGYYILLVTGRKECQRALTENYLLQLGLIWNTLVMGLPRGQRVLINDLKPDSIIPTALAYTVERNKGFEELPNI